jgi:serine/threonine protein kinase
MEFFETFKFFSTDVWALGCCLYSLAFLQNCFEEGSNLAILSRKFRIPEDNPYGDDLVELIDRMLTVNCKERADMTEVILCLSSIYSGRPLPPRKRGSKSDKSGNQRDKKEKKERVGTYRTDGQGIRKSTSEEKRPAEAKKLNPNSAAARRRKAAEEGGGTGTSAILLTRQSSKIRKPKSNKQTFHQPFNGDTSSFTRGGSAFAEVDDPFQIGEGKVGNRLFVSHPYFQYIQPFVIVDYC